MRSTSEWLECASLPRNRSKVNLRALLPFESISDSYSTEVQCLRAKNALAQANVECPGFGLNIRQSAFMEPIKQM